MSPTSSVSPENIASAPISQPKNLQEFGKMLDQEKSHISKEDYDAILLSLSSKQDTLKNNADRIGFEAQFTPIFLKDQIAALESAIRKEKAAKFNEKTNDLQKPAIQAAAQGDVKATKALAEVAKAQKPVDKQKAVETSEIVATTKVEVAKAKKDVVKTSVENTLPKQAESLIQYIETVSPILRGSDIISDMKSKLSDTNIRSLVSHLATGSVYVSDGAYG